MAAELVKTLDNRGAMQKVTAGKKVTVGKVNVEAGGQAIVGNVESDDTFWRFANEAFKDQLIALALGHAHVRFPCPQLAANAQQPTVRSENTQRRKLPGTLPSPERSAAACMAGQKVLVLLGATATR